MSNLDAITPLTLDPEELGRFFAKLPIEVIEQLVHNWRKPTRSEEENRLLAGLLRRMREENHRMTVTTPVIEAAPQHSETGAESS